MDTKLKKSRPFLTWLCFFLGVNIVVTLALLAVSPRYGIYNHIDDIKAALSSDVKDMSVFKNQIISSFNLLSQSARGELTDEESERVASDLKDEGYNLIYYSENLKTGRITTNIKSLDGILSDGSLLLPEGYDYYLFYNGGSLAAVKDGKPFDIYRNDSGYRHLVNYLSEGRSDIRVILMVKKDITENPYAYSTLYHIKRDTEIMKWMNYVFASVFLAGIILLVIYLIKRRNKREFDRKLAALSGKLWFEVKLFISLAFLLISLRIAGGLHSVNIGFYYSPYMLLIDDNISVIFTYACVLWWFYLMFLDLRANRNSFVRNNSINWMIARYRAIESKKPFQKAMLWRIYGLIAAETILVILTAFTIATQNGFASLFFVAAGIYLIYRYLCRFKKTVDDMGQVTDRIEAIKNGDMDNRLKLSQESDLFFAAENLGGIQDGIQKVVKEKMKSEHMKMELITNVSHDLKTPLTSIISYVDLLSKEEGLPGHVNDYITILSQKSERLKTLIQDLFELSKASSGAIEVETERLDIGKLIEQTLADINEQIEQSGLIFKVDIPDDPVYVLSDGKKLYRVFLNLFTNALKYSLDNSRIYVDLSVLQGKAVIEIKNIANYEMNFKKDEIIERFVRGDKSRTTEGSGLGLAIAQSFTRACGGDLDIFIDGDLFKVVLTFDWVI